MKKENKHLSPVDIAALKQTIIEKDGIISDQRKELEQLRIRLHNKSCKCNLYAKFYRQLNDQLNYFINYETE